MTTPTFEPVELPSRYGKAFVAIVAAVLAVVITALTDNVVTLTEGLGIGVAFVTALSVYLVPNLPSGAGRYAKAAVAVVGTGLQAAVPLVVDGGFPSSAWLLVALAALGALSVGITPNSLPTGELEAAFAEPRFGTTLHGDPPVQFTDEEVARIKERFFAKTGTVASDADVAVDTSEHGPTFTPDNYRYTGDSGSDHDLPGGDGHIQRGTE